MQTLAPNLCRPRIHQYAQAILVPVLGIYMSVVPRLKFTFQLKSTKNVIIDGIK